jgi:mRNA interferase MazF
LVICDQWDVVTVPFPFTEGPGTKRRPAVVVSKKIFNACGHTVLGMITSASHQPWPGDVLLAQAKAAGLTTACLVRLKLFTLDKRLLLRRIGRLSGVDTEKLRKSLHAHVL